jgi:tetratricopeptide (TPR) repeat protein
LAWIRKAHTLITEVREHDPTLVLPGSEWATVWVWGLEAALHTGDEAAFNTFLPELQPPPKRIPQRRLWSLRGRIWRGRWAVAHGAFATAEKLYRQTVREVNRLPLLAGSQTEAAVIARAELYELQGAFTSAQRRWQQAALANTFAIEQYRSLDAEDRVAYMGRVEQALERSARLSSIVDGWRAATERGIHWLTYRHQAHLPLLPAALEVIVWALRGTAWTSAQGLLEALRERPEHDKVAGDLWALQALLAGLQEQPETARQAWQRAADWYQAHPGVKSHFPWLRLTRIREALEHGERPVLPTAEAPAGFDDRRASAVWEALLSN